MALGGVSGVLHAPAAMPHLRGKELTLAGRHIRSGHCGDSLPGIELQASVNYDKMQKKINLLNMYIELHSCVICMKPSYEFYVCMLGSFKFWTAKVGMLEVGQRIGLQGDKESRLRRWPGSVCTNPGIFTTLGNTILPFRRNQQSRGRHKRPACVCVYCIRQTQGTHVLI
jgi:hypothetical protein